MEYLQNVPATTIFVERFLKAVHYVEYLVKWFVKAIRGNQAWKYP